MGFAASSEFGTVTIALLLEPKLSSLNGLGYVYFTLQGGHILKVKFPFKHRYGLDSPQAATEIMPAGKKNYYLELIVGCPCQRKKARKADPAAQHQSQ